MPGSGGGSGYLTPIMIRPTQNLRDVEPRKGADNGLKVRRKGAETKKKGGGGRKGKKNNDLKRVRKGIKCGRGVRCKKK